jgi:hypothetical protein
MRNGILDCYKLPIGMERSFEDDACRKGELAQLSEDRQAANVSFKEISKAQWRALQPLWHVLDALEQHQAVSAEAVGQAVGDAVRLGLDAIALVSGHRMALVSPLLRGKEWACGPAAPPLANPLIFKDLKQRLKFQQQLAKLTSPALPQKRKAEKPAEGPRPTKMKKPSASTICYSCQGKGHYSYDCPNRDQSANNHNSTPGGFSAGGGGSANKKRLAGRLEPRAGPAPS